MKKHKICVYAICKNEEKFVDRWAKSMGEADKIFVLDTGSTDNTIEKLKSYGIEVKQEIITPFRFDVARNKSLEMIPNDFDICVCTDLDEVFNVGWRKELENIWNKDINRLAYNYNWLLDDNNNPKINFYIEKIHERKNYIWIHPVHEVLKYTQNKERKIYTDKITLNHYPDNLKSRKSYLPLLELSIKEDPFDDRSMHYLGREYMYYKKWNKSIDTLIKHLSLPKSTWKDERCASMRFIARCYSKLNRYEEAKMWLNKAIKEAPHLRDPYVEMAILEYNNKNYKSVKKYCLKALKITTCKKTYINEVFSWDHTIYDLLSISYFYQKSYNQSLKYTNKAIKLCTNKKDLLRLKKNKKIIKDFIKLSK